MKPISTTKAIEIYLKDCDANEQSPRTIEGKISNLKCFKEYFLSKGITLLSDITEIDLEDYRQYIRHYRNPITNKEITQATRRNKLTCVKALFTRLFKLKHIETNPAATFDLPKRPKTLTKAILSMDELDKMFIQTELFGDKGIRDRAIMETFWSTGMRSFELTGLTTDCIDWEELTVRITKGKGKKDRLIPLGEIAADHIERYQSIVRRQLQTFESGDILFLNNNGKPFTYRQPGTLINSYKLRVGIKKPKACMLFRHTCATTMINNGAGLMHVQQLLGHEDISTTQAYVHLAINNLKHDFERTHPSAKR